MFKVFPECVVSGLYPASKVYRLKTMLKWLCLLHYKSEELYPNVNSFLVKKAIKSQETDADGNFVEYEVHPHNKR